MWALRLPILHITAYDFILDRNFDKMFSKIIHGKVAFLPIFQHDLNNSEKQLDRQTGR